MSNKIPAKKAMLYYFTNFTSEKEQGFQGRKRVTPPVLIDEELKLMYEAACKSITKEAAEKYLNKMPEQLKTLADFQHLEKAAKRKVTWRKTIPNIHELFKLQLILITITNLTLYILIYLLIHFCC